MSIVGVWTLWVVLGAPAVDDESLTLGELKAEWRKADEEGRVAVLQAAALIAADDPAKRSKASDLLAQGLEDPSFTVRNESIRLMRLEGDREVAVKAFADALGALEDVARLPRTNRGRGGGRGRAAADDGDEEGAQPADPFAAFRAALEERRSYVFALIEALGDLPDDRSVKALMDFLPETSASRVTQTMVVPAARSLVALEAQKGVEAVLRRLESEVERQEERDREEAERGKESERGGGDGTGAGRGRGRGGRGGGRGGIPDLGELEGLLGDLMNEAAAGAQDDEAESAAPLVEQLHALLVAAGEAQGLEGMPEWGEDAVKEWKVWWGKHRRSFPRKLGRIDPDPHAEEERDDGR